MYSHLREDFPTLRGENSPSYLDNACVTLKPDSVIESITDYYRMYPGCGGRSVHRYGTQVSKLVAEARQSIAKFINANSVNEVVFTRNATHSLNQIAKGLSWEKGDVIITGDREHNSNLVPWLQLAEEQGIEHRIVKSNPDNTFNLDNFEQLCDEVGDRLKLVSLSHIGNLDGVSVPIKQIAKITHQYDALMAVDGAQSTHTCVLMSKIWASILLHSRFTKCVGHQEWVDCGAAMICLIQCGLFNRADKLLRHHIMTLLSGQLHRRSLKAVWEFRRHDCQW